MAEYEYNAPDGSAVTTSVFQLEYDGQGLLLRITEDGNIRRLVRDRTEALARPLVEMGATTNAVRWFVWANGKLLAQVASNGTIRVAHSDELGKILALTDNNGALTDEYAYQPYGRMIAHSGTNDLPFAFMGDYGIWNAGSGLYLTRHRAYNSSLMLFLQPDPAGIDGCYNYYSYANANPMSAIDPMGLDAIYFVGGNRENPSYFGDIAESYASSYEHSHANENTYIIEVRSNDDIANALSQYGNLNQVTYLGHAFPGGLNPNQDNANEISSSDIYSLPTYNVNQGAEINLWGCNTAVANGLPNGESTGQAFANHFNASVNAVNGGLSFGLPVYFITDGIHLFTLWPSLRRGDEETIKPNM